jgi:L-histidine N-alpha-methyltransferase
MPDRPTPRPRGGTAAEVGSRPGEVAIDVHLGPDDLDAALRRDVARGLTSTPKELPPKWFYDDVGSQLFDEITRLPEYYPTRAETEILRREAATIAALSGADTLVELGSGTSTKTRILLDALRDAGTLRRVVPFDVSETTLREASETLAADYPGVAVHAVVGDFERHLHALPPGGRRLVAFLGSTIGNLRPAERARLLEDLRRALAPGDALLLGTDLVKDPDRLVRAYDDAAGVTAAFNRNVLRVLDRRLGADFDVERFGHVARWDAIHERIEMWLRADDAQLVHVPALELTVRFSPGEEMRTEISSKFRRDGVAAELAGAGFRLDHWWTDQAGDFGLSLSTPRGGSGATKQAEGLDLGSGAGNPT